MSMIKYLVFTIAFCAVATVYSAESEDKYSTAFDSLDVNGILYNRGKLNEFCKCLLDEGNCSDLSEQIKHWIKDSIKNKCGRCSEKQKENAKKIIKYLFVNESEWWKKLEEKYDPQHIYRKQYVQELLKMKS